MNKQAREILLQRAVDSLKIESKSISDIIDYLDADAFCRAVKL